MRKLFFSLLLITTGITVSAQDKFSGQFKAIDKYMDSLIQQWNIPGMAVGIVHRDKLIYKKGFGYRNMEKKLPVDAQTNFPIASNTKLFTATLATMLAVEGKLDLDKPVKYYLPTLEFATDELNAKVSIRDMLSHRTGIPGYDALWVGGTVPRDSMIARLKLIQPRYALREGYIYNNVLYSTAGVVLEAVTGQSWEEQVRKKLFEPLQMNRSGFSDLDDRSANFSLSYLEPDSAGRFIPRLSTSQNEALGPAGTIFSNVEDMSHWMIAQLNEGKYAGKQVIAPAAIKETMIPHILSDRTGRWEELSHAIYCLGRSVMAYKGLRMWAHTGSIDGFYSQLTFIPGEELAIFVVGNSANSSYLRSTMTYPIIDRLLNLEYTDWSSRAMREYLNAKNRQLQNRQRGNAPAAKKVPADHPLTAYVGKYTHPLLGAVEVGYDKDKLTVEYRKIRADLHHDNYEQFITRQGPGFSDFRLNFLTNAQGRVHAMMMGVYGENGLFERVP